MVMNATFSSTAPSGAVQGISDDLHVSAEAAGLVTTMFLLGYVAGPRESLALIFITWLELNRWSFDVLLL